MTANARDKELAEEAAREYLLGGSYLAGGDGLAAVIARALAKQREEFENNSAAKHWHDLYRKECLLRQDDAARFGQAREDAESTLGALQLQFELRGEIIERLTQERDQILAVCIERCAKIAERYERDPIDGELAVDDGLCSRAIRSLKV